MKICLNCRNIYDDTEKFCVNCGCGLTDMNIQQDIPPADIPLQNQQTQYYQREAAEQSAASPNKNTILAVFVAVLSVIVLALVGVLIWQLAKNSDSDMNYQSIDVNGAVVTTNVSSDVTSDDSALLFIEGTTVSAAEETSVTETETTEEEYSVTQTRKTTSTAVFTRKKATETKRSTATKKTSKKTTTAATEKTTVTTTVTTTEKAAETEKSLPVIDMGEYETFMCKSNGHTYVLVNASMSWVDANEFCAELGGHLATVSDEEEQELLTELAELCEEKQNFWLGGYYNGQYAEWYWIDGEEFTYTNWDSWSNGEEVFAQPDNYTGDEYRLRFVNADIEYDDWIANKGKWNDTSNEADGDSGDAALSTFAFICEFDFEAEIN